MPARSSCGVVCLAALAACSAGDNRVDPGDLELRDVLGISPDAALAWTADQRDAARRVLAAGLAAAAPSRRAPTGDALDAPLGLDERIAALISDDDDARAADGAAALGAVELAIDPHGVAAIAPRRAPHAAAALTGSEPLHPCSVTAGLPPSIVSCGVRVEIAIPRVELHLERWRGSPRWSALPGRGGALLAALAVDAGHPGGSVLVVPAPRLAAIAAYLRAGEDGAAPRLVVNPVALAALDPVAGESEGTASLGVVATAAQAAPAAAALGAPPAVAAPGTAASTGGNPYSFYGSVAECAFVQRTRCEACLPASSCRPITSASSGNDECRMLGADDGRGYFLLCINLSLAISSIEDCSADDAPSCPRDPGAADSLASLDHNAGFLDDPACAGALDACLARIFGPPDGEFPGPGPDAGTTAPPPRSTSVSCSNSCDNNPNTSCSASPSCDCTGPSCNNSLSCDGACSSSNDQSGCGGNCNACTSSGGGDGGGGGGCSDGGGGGSSSSSGCGGGSGSSSSSGCGGGSGGSGGGCNSGCSNSSGGSSCSGGGCSNSGCSNSSGGKCSAAVDPAPGVGFALSLMWATLPVALAGLTRRRARRRLPVRARDTHADTPDIQLASHVTAAGSTDATATRDQEERARTPIDLAPACRTAAESRELEPPPERTCATPPIDVAPASRTAAGSRDAEPFSGATRGDEPEPARVDASPASSGEVAGRAAREEAP